MEVQTLIASNFMTQPDYCLLVNSEITIPALDLPSTLQIPFYLKSTIGTSLLVFPFVWTEVCAAYISKISFF